MTTPTSNENGEPVQPASGMPTGKTATFILTDAEKAAKAAQDRALLDKAIHEQRKSARKTFKTRVLVAFEDAPPVQAVTVDISTGGLCLGSVPRQLKNGQRVRVTCDLLSLGKSHRMVVVCQVTHCLFSGDGFKVGVQFLDLDPALLPVIDQIVKS